MAVLINTNLAATNAANNLAASAESQQRILNRLSSGSKIVRPSDDAGGLAVSMKFSAAARRMGAINNNLANAMSFLQMQDGALSVTAKILNRVSELKTLYLDPTKNASDKANYNVEFQTLQQEILAIGGENFNGKALFSSTATTVGISDDQSQTVDLTAINLLGTSSGSVPDFSSSAGWTISGTATISGGALTLGAGSSITSNTSFSGALTLKYTTTDSNPIGWKYGGVGSGTISDSAGKNYTVAWDGAGNQTVSVNGAPFMSGGGGGTSGQLQIYTTSGITIANASVTGSPGGTGNINTITSAASLAALDMNTISGALQDVATYRAQVGANQSRIAYSTDLLIETKANLETATSRITDVDVAEDSTALARMNVLVQAGTSMLSQANQANQGAIRLLS